VCLKCDREASIMRRPWPTRGCRAIKKRIIKISVEQEQSFVTVVSRGRLRTTHRHTISAQGVNSVDSADTFTAGLVLE
jgi:hypothetical protein